MLVLKVKEGRSLHIGAGIVLKVVSVHGHSVKLGIEAPRDVRVVREELLEPQRAAGLS